MREIYNLHVKETARLIPPNALRELLPLTEAANQTVVAGREEVTRILEGKDPRLLVVVGPCSIHHPRGAIEFATRLAALRTELSRSLCLVMRVYFEKPRTTLGWKGLINDPSLNGTYDIETGLRLARELLLRVNAMGLPAATEFLDPIIPQYIAELISWAAIGARTTESQTHRELASGLSMPVGFKNGTDGELQVAIDACCASRHSHNFLGIDADGFTSIVRTTGNPGGHIVLRGGRKGPNYGPESVRQAEAQLRKANLPAVMIVDCSHANSEKKFRRQTEVWASIVQQRLAGTSSIVGAMIESNLFEGNQPIPADPTQLAYGVSVTDACLGWEDTEQMLREGARALARWLAG